MKKLSFKKLEDVLCIVMVTLVYPCACITITNLSFVKYSTRFESFWNACKVGESFFERSMTYVSHVPVCLEKCSEISECAAFYLDREQRICKFYNLIFGLHYAIDADGEPKDLYVKVTNQPNYGPDVARFKLAQGTLYRSNYSQPQSTTFSSTCGIGDTDCWCSGYDDRRLRIDLGYSRNIIRVFVTISRKWPDSTNDLRIHIGDSSTTSDPLFGSMNTPPANQYRIEFIGSGTGRHITMERMNNPYSFCVCMVEAYEK